MDSEPQGLPTDAPSRTDSRAAIAGAAIVAAMACVVLAVAGLGAGAGSRFAGAIALLALLGNLFALSARYADTRRTRAIAHRAGTVLGRISAIPLPQTRDAIGDIDARLAAIDAAIEPVRHRLARRHRATGLPTREPLIAAIKRDLANECRGTLGIVEFCDFDRLSAFDLEVADQLIATLADRIAAMVGDHAMVAQIDRARIGLWFPIAERDAAMREIDAICYALGSRIQAGDQEIMPEIATGRAAAPDDGDAPEALLMTAISTLAGVQRRVGAETETAAPAVTRAREAFVLEQDLRHAVARGEFELAYQPLVDAARGAICGAEALIRWRHPTRGPILPSIFIPMVEAAGLAEEVGMWALNTACRQARRWRGAGLGGLSVAVNLSAYQLQRADLPSMIARTMARHGIAPGMLEIELTETVVAGDVALTRTLFDALRALGVAIAIDDFGTGYSSLSYLRQLSFDKLKIDREFVTEVDRRPTSQAICQSLVALGRGLGIRVLAEGIERREEFDWLRQHGCTLFQGFYFARPVSAADFAALVTANGVADQLSATAPRGLQAQIQKRMGL